jgi:RHS repeat-associated protein
MLVYTTGYACEYFYHLDNTRVVLDTDKNVVERYDYYPFGLVSRSTVSDEPGTIQKFTGKELDDEHGIDLYYFGARYHDPVNGRFISVDPLAEENAGWSPYSYSKNNPLNRIDPDGRNDLLAQLAAHFSAESHKTAKDYNNFASSRIVIPQTGIDQSGAETFADAVRFLNDSAEPGRLDTAKGFGKISDVTAKASAVCYSGTLLAAPAPPVSTALAFSGMEK